jgi:uncharacterized repeat protein (TIGR03803 family)
MRSKVRPGLVRAISVPILALCIWIGMSVSPIFAAEGLEKVIHSFQGGSDGQYPTGGLIADRAGNLYGMTMDTFATAGCTSNCGTVFELSPPTTAGSAWTKSTLHSFRGGNDDGSRPSDVPVLDGAGNLYGTTLYGGSGDNGVIFELSPSATSAGAWTETILYNFPADGSRGKSPNGGLTFDAEGNLYGVTAEGGLAECDCGTVFQLSPPDAAGESWTQTVIHKFDGYPTDGGNPVGSLVFDLSGALYGTTQTGGISGWGSVFQMKRHKGEWRAKVIYGFPLSDFGIVGISGRPSIDTAGNLFGNVIDGGNSCDCGGIWELSPASTGTAPWTFNTVYEFYVPFDANQLGGTNPSGSLLIDKSGNLYGAAGGGLDRKHEEHDGIVFELSPPSSPGGARTKKVLHEFSGAAFGDGRDPIGGIVMVAGKLYGVTSLGGTVDLGSVYSLTVVP